MLPCTSLHVLSACINGRPLRDTHITSKGHNERGETGESEIVRLDQVYILIAARISDTTIPLVCISRARKQVSTFDAISGLALVYHHSILSCTEVL